MKTRFHLIVKSNGSTRTVKHKPDVRWDEVCIALEVELPDRVFERPQLEGNIVVKDDQLPETIIPVDIQDNIESAIQEHTGVAVRLQVVNQEEEG